MAAHRAAEVPARVSIHAAFLIAAAACIGATPSGAQPVQPARTPSQARPPADPNQKICEDMSEIGSRLAVKRICATRSEWQQKRQDDKDLVDQIQRSPCVVDEDGHCT